MRMKTWMRVLTLILALLMSCGILSLMGCTVTDTDPEPDPEPKPEPNPEPDPVEIPFTDVKANWYYTEPILWALEKGITTGTGPDTFTPDAPCTRAQVVTFLWRAMGQPQAFGAEAFTDLEKGSWYEDAVVPWLPTVKALA